MNEFSYIEEILQKNLHRTSNKTFFGFYDGPSQVPIDVWALFFLLLSSLLDFIDGAVARYMKKTSIKGAYLDTICDRYVEGLIFLGLLLINAILRIPR